MAHIIDFFFGKTQPEMIQVSSTSMKSHSPSKLALAVVLHYLVAGKHAHLMNIAIIYIRVTKYSSKKMQ